MDDFRYAPTDLDETQWILESMVGAVAVGILFGVADLAYGAWFEATIMPSLRIAGSPTLSYGQMAALMWLLTTFLGAAVGFSVGIARRFNLLVAAILPAVGSQLLGAIVALTWRDSLQRYGRDPSDWVVFVPARFAAGIALGIALVMVIVGWLRRAKAVAS